MKGMTWGDAKKLLPEGDLEKFLVNHIDLGIDSRLVFGFPDALDLKEISIRWDEDLGFQSVPAGYLVYLVKGLIQKREMPELTSDMQRISKGCIRIVEHLTKVESILGELIDHTLLHDDDDTLKIWYIIKGLRADFVESLGICKRMTDKEKKNEKA